MKFLAALAIMAMAFAVLVVVLPANDANDTFNITVIDDDYLWDTYPVSDLVGDDYMITVVPDEVEPLTSYVYVSGTLFWYDDIEFLDPEITKSTYKHGYFVPFKIVLPGSMTFDDISAKVTYYADGEQCSKITNPQWILIPEASSLFQVDIEFGSVVWHFIFDLASEKSNIDFKPLAEYFTDVSGFEGVIHGFKGNYVDNMFDLVFYDDIGINLAEVYFLGEDPEAEGDFLYSRNLQLDKIESRFWVAYSKMDSSVPHGDGYYKIVVKNNVTGAEHSAIVLKGAENGIFVDAVNGDDKNEGTQASPVKTIEKAIELLGEDADKIVLLSDYTAEGAVIELPQFTIDLNGHDFTVSRPVYIVEDQTVTITDSGKEKGAMYIGKDGFGDVALFNMGTITVDGAAVYADVLHVAYASYLAQGTLGEIVATNAAFIYGDKDWDKGSEWSVWVGDADDSYFALGEGTNAIVTQEGPTSALISILAASEPDSATEVAPFAEVRGDFVTNGVDIEIGENVTVTVLGSIELSIFEGESVTEVSDIVVDTGASLVSGIDPDGNLAPVKMWKGTAISLMNGATFSGIIEAGVGTAEYSKADGTFTAGEGGILIVAGSITISGVLDATIADAILENAEGTVILDGLTVIGDGNKLRINDGEVIIKSLALDGCDVVIATDATVVIDGSVTSVGETESTIVAANAASITTTGSADIEVEVDTGDNYPEYKDGDRVMKDGTMFTIGHAKASSGRIVQFGVALSILVYNGEDQKGEIKNATVTSFDNFYKWTSAGMPRAWIWPDDPKTEECRHAGYYNLEVYFGVTNNVTTTTINALMKDCALIEQAPSDVTLVKYEATKVYDAYVGELGTYYLTGGEDNTYNMTGFVMCYNGSWAPGTWPEDMSEGYYVVFQVKDLAKYVADFPDAAIMLVDSEWKAFDGFLLKFIGTTIQDVAAFNAVPFEFYLDNDGIYGEFDDYKPTLYTINMALVPSGYDVTISEIDGEYIWGLYPVSEVVSDDFDIIVYPANPDNDAYQFDHEFEVKVTGTFYWFDGMWDGTAAMNCGYFIPYQVILPDSKTLDDVSRMYLITQHPWGDDQWDVDKILQHVTILDFSRQFIFVLELEGESYGFAFNLEDADFKVAYQPAGEYIANVSGYEGVLHGFVDNYVDDMFDIVFADDFGVDTAEVYFLAMDPESAGERVYTKAFQTDAFENIFWVAYADLDPAVTHGDGFYKIVVKNSQTEEERSIIVMRGNGIEFVWHEISNLVMDCGEYGENFSAVVAQEPDDDGVYHVDFTANKLYYVPQWVINVLAELGIDLKAGYYLGFEIDFAGEILSEEATVIFPDATIDNPIGYKYNTGLYLVYLGANKAFLQDRYVTIDADGDGEFAPVDFKLCVCGAREEVAIGFAAAGIILKDSYIDDAGEEHDYDDIYLNCENGDYVKLPNGKDSTRNFVRWSIEASDERAYNWDSIYIVSWYDDINVADGQIVFTAVYDDTPGPQPVVTEYTITVDYVCDGDVIYSETEVVIEDQYYFFDCDVPELEDYVVPRDYVAGKALADETIVIECFEKTVSEEYKLLITTSIDDEQHVCVDYVCVAVDGIMEYDDYEITITGKYIEYDEELELYTSEEVTMTFDAQIVLEVLFMGTFDLSEMDHYSDLYSIVLECPALGVTSVVASLV
jgi:hypothetical protein